MKNKLRLIAAGSALGLGISLALTSIAFAAGLNWSADATITLGSANYTILSGSAATSIIVDTSTITVAVPTGSYFSLRSANRYPLNNNQSIAQTCTASYNELEVNGSTTSATVIITPNTTSTCTIADNGGGGGGGGTPATTPPATTTTPTSTTGSVTATPTAGGTTSFTPSDSSTPSVNVSMPANAVSSDTTVSVTNTTLASANIVIAPSTAGITNVIGSPYSFTAASGSTSVTSFSQNVTLTFTYTDAQLPAGVTAASLGVFYFNTTTNAWVSLPATVNTTTHTITVVTNHFTVFVVGVSSSSNNTVVTTSNAHPNGTLVYSGSTYYLIQNGERIGFRDAAEYQSYGYKFAQGVAATSGDLALSMSSVAKAMEGTLVLDSSDNRTVYMIGTGAVKRGFVSSTVFKALGYSFTGLPKINLTDYPVGAVISSSTAAHPDGSLVFQGKTIWWLKNGQKVGFETMTVFNTYGFSVARVLQGNAADFAMPEGAIIKFRDGTLVLDGGTYYLISDGKKLSFASAADLTAKGYKTSNAISASLAAYASGGSVQ